jgi:hypothetical protein
LFDTFNALIRSTLEGLSIIICFVAAVLGPTPSVLLEEHLLAEQALKTVFIELLLEWA